MDKYRRVPKQKETESKPDNEIRVTAVGSVSAYVSFAAKVFNEMSKDDLVVKATGNALAKAVTLAEVIKRRFKGLHQLTNVTTQEIVDEYEPLEEGLDRVIDKRNVAYVEITLSKTELDTKHVGYQAPLDESMVVEYDAEEMSRSRGRGRGRGKGRGKGKSAGKSKGKEKGSGKGKSKSKSPGKGKDKDSSLSKGKGKSKSKGKGKSKWDDDYYSGGRKGGGKDDYYGGSRKGGKKGKSSSKGYSKGKGGGSSSKGKGSYSSWDQPWDSWSSWNYTPQYDRGKGKSKQSYW